MSFIEFVVIFLMIFVVAVSMTMVGKGGGNFYVVILIFAGISAHESAATSQFILFPASFTGILVFGKDKAVNWKLAFFVGVFVASSAFAGGFLSYLFDEFTLKTIFAVLLVAAGIAMIVPYTERVLQPDDGYFGILRISSVEGDLAINLKIVLPVTIATGFFSGMIGVSGGSFLVPMLVLACNIPMKSSVTTVTPLIAVSALMGFFGHILQGHFDPFLGIPLAAVTVIGGYIGGRFALKSKPKNLKQLFAVSNVLAALLIIANLIITHSWI